MKKKTANKRFGVYGITSVHGYMETLLANLTRDELLEFIIELDMSVAEWEFTGKLNKYFIKEMKKLAEEDKRESE